MDEDSHAVPIVELGTPGQPRQRRGTAPARVTGRSPCPRRSRGTHGTHGTHVFRVCLGVVVLDVFLLQREGAAGLVPIVDGPMGVPITAPVPPYPSLCASTSHRTAGDAALPAPGCHGDSAGTLHVPCLPSEDLAASCVAKQPRDSATGVTHGCACPRTRGAPVPLRELRQSRAEERSGVAVPPLLPVCLKRASSILASTQMRVVNLGYLEAI